MRHRWIIWFGGIFALALLSVFPLRIALGMSDLGSIGFTARQVAGTIWNGRIGELQLRSQSLGTFEVALDPAALIFGSMSMQFRRLDSPDGLLSGRLFAGGRRGVIEASGRIATGEMFKPLPVEALELSKVTALFRNGRCVEASGEIRPVIALGLPGVNLAGDLLGKVECDGERARVEMATPSGAERIDFYVQETGDYRAWLSIRAPSPQIAGALAAAGFRPTENGMTLSVDGRL